MTFYGISDTGPEVDEMLVTRWRAMTPAEKLRQVEQLNAAVEALAVAGIRARHPHADDEEVRMRLISVRVGADLTAAAYGWREPESEALIR